MNLAIIPLEIAQAIEFILDKCDGNELTVLEEMINTLPATKQGLIIRQFSKDNWELVIKALVYGYEIG